MFATTLVIDQGHEPLSWAGLPATVQNWLLVAGAFAGFGLTIWFIAFAIRWFGPARGRDHNRPTVAWLAGSVFGGVLLAVIAVALPRLWTRVGWTRPGTTTAASSNQLQDMMRSLGDTKSLLLLSLAGFAVVAVTLPILRNAIRLRWRRIWALARLSMKEAIRSKILWAFSFLLLVFLFGSWFITAEPAQQVKTYVETVYAVMTLLLLLTAGLLAALSLPSDIRRQTIHTILTKPVERFEIVVGRFIGYTLLMGAVLAVMTLFSLVYVWRGVDPDAKKESLRARVPVFGELETVGSRSVGREWGYRKYIGLMPMARGDQKAVWRFYDIPASLANRPDHKVRLEYGFDIFRLTKGRVEGEPVFASFQFETPRWDEHKLTEYKAKRDREYEKARRQHPREDLRSEIDNRLAEEYGYFEIADAEVVDFHTLARDVPSGLFKDLQAAADQPGLKVTVRCTTPDQFLGVAQPDLYLLQRDGSDNLSVAWNFYKGAMGIGLLLTLVIGVAVTCSTYLNGVISFLLTFSLIGAGLIAPFIQELAERRSAGGGPMESLLRLSTGSPISKPLDKSPTSQAATFVDAGFSEVMKALLYMLPRVKRLSLTDYVARGFDISTEKLLLDSCLPLIGYLFLWIVIAYYLIRSREIAA